MWPKRKLPQTPPRGVRHVMSPTTRCGNKQSTILLRFAYEVSVYTSIRLITVANDSVCKTETNLRK